jgi:hypothetical protein
MSDYSEKVVVCDRCYPDYLPSFTFFPLETVRGVVRGDLTLAYMKGWEDRDYGHACPDCVKLEAEQDEEGGEVVLGQVALESVTGAQNEDAA